MFVDLPDPDLLTVLSPGRPYRGKPSDMWALGVVLFTMLYGQFPFYDSIPQELFRKIKAAEYSIPEWVVILHVTYRELWESMEFQLLWQQSQLIKSTVTVVFFQELFQHWLCGLVTHNHVLQIKLSLPVPHPPPPTSSQGRSCVWEHSVPDPKAAGVGSSAKAYCSRSAGVSQCHHCIMVIAPPAGCLKTCSQCFPTVNHFPCWVFLITGSLFHHWVAPCRWCRILTIRSITQNICKR